MKQKSFAWIVAIIIAASLFIVVPVFSQIFEWEVMPSQFYGALIGTVITAIITVLLLQGQTAIEEEKDISIHVFEKKQEVYHRFIEALEKITQDGKLNVPGTENYEVRDDGVRDELQDLIYQLALVQMHASTDTAKAVTEKVGSLITAISKMHGENGEIKKATAADYSALAGTVFEIVALLRKDLYSPESRTTENSFEPIKDESFKSTLKNSGFFEEEFWLENNCADVMSDFCSLLFSEIGNTNKFLPDTEKDSKMMMWWEKNNREHLKWQNNSTAIQEYYSRKEDNRISLTKWFRLPIENAEIHFVIEFSDGGGYGFNQQGSGWLKKIDFPVDIKFWSKNKKFLEFAKSDENGRKNIIVPIVTDMNNEIKKFIENSKK